MTVHAVKPAARKFLGSVYGFLSAWVKFKTCWCTEEAIGSAGVIAAAALKCMGGTMQGRLWPRSDEERQKAKEAGYDISRVRCLPLLLPCSVDPVACLSLLIIWHAVAGQMLTRVPA